jgi:hypothetical protein
MFALGFVKTAKIRPSVGKAISKLPIGGAKNSALRRELAADIMDARKSLRGPNAPRHGAEIPVHGSGRGARGELAGAGGLVPRHGQMKNWYTDYAGPRHAEGASYEGKKVKPFRLDFKKG